MSKCLILDENVHFFIKSTKFFIKGIVAIFKCCSNSAVFIKDTVPCLYDPKTDSTPNVQCTLKLYPM